MIKDTNPDHYKVDGADFAEYILDPKIGGFGDWMFANGFNSGALASTIWNSVEDTPPPEGEIVIGYTPVDGCMFVGFYKTYKCSWQDTAVGYWYILTARHSTKRITKKVTHWMPRPEPPEKKVKCDD